MVWSILVSRIAYEKKVDNRTAAQILVVEHVAEAMAQRGTRNLSYDMLPVTPGWGMRSAYPPALLAQIVTQRALQFRMAEGITTRHQFCRFDPRTCQE